MLTNYSDKWYYFSVLMLSAHQSFTLAVQSDIKVSPPILAPIETLLLSWLDLRKVQRRFCDAFWSLSYQNVDVYTANFKNKIVCQMQRIAQNQAHRSRTRRWEGRATQSISGSRTLTTFARGFWVRCVLFHPKFFSIIQHLS